MDTLVSVFSYMSSLSVEDLPQPTVPWLGEWDGEACSWATNGRMAIAIRGGGGTEPPQRGSGRMPFNKALQKWLTSERANVTTVPRRDLERWAGPVSGAEEDECDSCDGEGYMDGDTITCEHCHNETRSPCDECGGEGTVPRPLKDFAGVIIGQAIDRRHLAKLLAVVPASVDVTVSRPMYPSESVRFDGADWVAVLMGVRDHDDAPAFNVDTAAAVK